jgi:outer membrane protein insertion porin family
MYGYGSYYGGYDYGYGYTNYESYYDPDKYITLLGASVGWGKRLHWPDDYFTIYGELAYTRYNLKNWSYFLINNGTCNNINLAITLGRNSTDNQLYPRFGSDFSLTVSATPPYSLWDGVDYSSLADDQTSASYQRELQEKHKWIEYHKWKFRGRTYTALTGGQKCLVLMTRADFGLLGHYNKYKRSPFETFYVDGDGMSGGSYTYATEMVALRGYDNGSLSYYNESYAYARLAAELRFPLIMENSTTIYALAFVEGGNAWAKISDFKPFDQKRSAGVGVRVFLPMVGMMGIDWAYGFDPVNGSKQYSGSQVHFILGQEF